MEQLVREDQEQQLQTAHDKVKELTGEDMALFRPPYGDYNDDLIQLAEVKGYFSIRWDVDSKDWKDYGVDNIIDTIINHESLQNGSIILCHSGTRYTAQALDGIISGLKDRGYEIVPVSELIYREDYHMDVTGRQIKDK